MNDVKIINNFISKEDIVLFTSYLDKNYLDQNKFRHRVGVAFNKGLAARAVFPDEKPPSMFKELEIVINKYSNLFINECKKTFSDNRNIFFYGVSLTRLSKDIQLRIHQDIHHDFVDLLYSGVIYLNDNYEGGEIVFLDNYEIKDDDYTKYGDMPEKILFPKYHDSMGGLVYKPKSGDIVIFPATKYHGGKIISEGTRDSIIFWCTLDKKYEFEGFNSNRIIGENGYIR